MIAGLGVGFAPGLVTPVGRVVAFRGGHVARGDCEYGHVVVLRRDRRSRPSSNAYTGASQASGLYGSSGYAHTRARCRPVIVTTTRATVAGSPNNCTDDLSDHLGVVADDFSAAPAFDRLTPSSTSKLAKPTAE